MKQSELTKKYLLNFDKIMPILAKYYVELFGSKYKTRINNRLKNLPVVFTGDKEDWGQMLKILAIAYSAKGKRPEYEAGLKYVQTLSLKDRNLLTEDGVKFLEAYLKGLNKEDALNYINDISEFKIYSACCYYDITSDLSKVKIFVHFPIGGDEFLRDKTIVHELLHVIAVHMGVAENGKINFGGGLQNYVKKLETEGETFEVAPDIFNKTELFNEALTEHYTIKILNKMAQNKEMLVYSNYLKSTYEKVLPIMSYVFDRLEPLLKDCYMSGDVQPIVDLIGQENYIKLLKYNNEIYLSNLDFTLAQAHSENPELFKQTSDLIKNAQRLPYLNYAKDNAVFGYICELKQIADQAEAKIQKDKK